MDINTIIKSEFSKYLRLKYEIDFHDFEIQQTRKDFKGDITIVIFLFIKSKYFQVSYSPHIPANS